eukprot:GHVR01110146.1.p1 GENE.GHVR01110146.1~~GHVR01110146.1.p1  ORF type:complete len:222 (-),score=87.59 GHVR01110146.1:123-788(-)
MTLLLIKIFTFLFIFINGTLFNTTNTLPSTLDGPSDSDLFFVGKVIKRLEGIKNELERQHAIDYTAWREYELWATAKQKDYSSREAAIIRLLDETISLKEANTHRVSSLSTLLQRQHTTLKDNKVALEEVKKYLLEDEHTHSGEALQNSTQVIESAISMLVETLPHNISTSFEPIEENNKNTKIHTILDKDFEVMDEIEGEIILTQGYKHTHTHTHTHTHK